MPKNNAAGDPYVRPFMVRALEELRLILSSAKLPSRFVARVEGGERLTRVLGSNSTS